MSGDNQYDIQKIVLEAMEGKMICPSCKGSGKEELSFNYDTDDKESSCHNMLSQIDKVTRGCICSECNGEGKIDLPMWNREKEKMIAFRDEIYKNLLDQDHDLISLIAQDKKEISRNRYRFMHIDTKNMIKKGFVKITAA